MNFYFSLSATVLCFLLSIGHRLSTQISLFLNQNGIFLAHKAAIKLKFQFCFEILRWHQLISYLIEQHCLILWIIYAVAIKMLFFVKIEIILNKVRFFLLILVQKNFLMPIDIIMLIWLCFIMVNQPCPQKIGYSLDWPRTSSGEPFH